MAAVEISFSSNNILEVLGGRGGGGENLFLQWTSQKWFVRVLTELQLAELFRFLSLVTMLPLGVCMVSFLFCFSLLATLHDFFKLMALFRPRSGSRGGRALSLVFCLLVLTSQLGSQGWGIKWAHQKTGLNTSLAFLNATCCWQVRSRSDAAEVACSLGRVRGSPGLTV